MSVDYHQLIEELRQEYEKARERTGELRRKVSELTVTVTAPRETLKVTVGAQGDVRAIEFPTGAYKRMAPAELSAALMTALTEAKEKAQVQLGELMAPSMPEGISFHDIVSGQADMPALNSVEAGMPRVVMEYLTDGAAAPGGTGGDHV
jgi:DNA-binding protein YbaB